MDLSDAFREIRTQGTAITSMSERLSSLQLQFNQLHQAQQVHFSQQTKILENLKRQSPSDSSDSYKEILDSKLTDRLLQFQEAQQTQFSQLHHTQAMQIKILESFNREIPYESMLLIKEIVRSEVVESLSRFQPAPQMQSSQPCCSHDNQTLNVLKREIIQEQAACFKEIVDTVLTEIKTLSHELVSMVSGVIQEVPGKNPSPVQSWMLDDVLVF
jgi:hypothetical protein